MPDTGPLQPTPAPVGAHGGNPPTPTDAGMVSVAEAAAILGCSTDHVRRHAPVVRLGRRVLVPREWPEGSRKLSNM